MLTDSTGFQYPIYDNLSNFWIGATSTNAKSHTGQTIISSEHTGTAGNSTIKVAVPNAANTASTVYDVAHSGNILSILLSNLIRSKSSVKDNVSITKGNTVQVDVSCPEVSGFNRIPLSVSVTNGSTNGSGSSYAAIFGWGISGTAFHVFIRNYYDGAIKIKVTVYYLLINGNIFNIET